MTIQEYTQAIKSSNIGDEIKAQILAILEPATEIDDEMEDSIAALIQQDIEQTLEAEADEQAKKEFAQVDAQFDKDVSVVERQLETDLATLDQEFTDLETAATELNGVIEEVQIASIKSDLAKQS